MQQLDVTEALRALVALLTKYGHEGQVRYVEDLVQRKETGDPGFEERFASIDMWGGSGAVWEVNLDPFHRSATHADDEHRFRRVIVALAQYLNGRKIGSPPVRERARFIAAVFLRWDEQGL